ncbi:hypothetical protein CYLTODRAFT_402460 [Cylindrobasidium torrendii FP15055 ss-10]|uniref:Symplekin n=1 Tax=Cylindrobasidium torrendii FP15055 ss-10 TaxID=1314674 RepID=A0A0D7B1J4_9AGAR|nr:hypothetical protein CYLTODRAFT_402460 [Cylindrobasidium torrendii FP15055 ss-10]
MSGDDPLQTLKAALSAPTDSPEQAERLGDVRRLLESKPALIRTLVGVLIGTVVKAADSLVKRWLVDLIHYALCRSSLSPDEKTQFSLQVLDQLAQLLEDPTQAIQKVAIESFTAVYPYGFRFFCQNRSNVAAWQTLLRCKTRILALVETPGTRNGLRAVAVKFAQRVILVQTRGIADPRLQNKNDPNLSILPLDHPFLHANQLQQEGERLMHSLMSTVLTTTNVDLLSAILNSWATLSKQRPGMTSAIVSTLGSWNPGHLVGQSASMIKSAEKAVRILLIHISRVPVNQQYHAQIGDILHNQGARMDKAAMEERRRRAGKRPTDDQGPAAKRQRLDDSTPSILAAFDFTTLPAPLITELILANLEAFPAARLDELVDAHRAKLLAASQPPPQPQVPPHTVTPVPVSTPPVIPKAKTEPAPTPAPPAQVVKTEEPIDPLQMDIDQEEIEFEPERLNQELSTETIPEPEEPPDADISLADIKFGVPVALDDALMKAALGRIQTGAEEIRANVGASANAATDMSMLLLVRIITRVAKPPPELTGEELAKREEGGDKFYDRQDSMRQQLCEYIMADFSQRLRLAVTWMNEEWYNDRIRQDVEGQKWRPNYETWLNQIISRWEALLENKDKSFQKFLLDLPDIPNEVLTLLRELCMEAESQGKQQIGFNTLRAIAVQRPALRQEAVTILLELTTHPAESIRRAAINAVRSWVLKNQPMDTMVRVFALQMLRKLQKQKVIKAPQEDTVMLDGESKANGAVDADSEMKDVSSAEAPAKDAMQVDGQESKPVLDSAEDDDDDGELVQTPYLPERIELPAQKRDILQHVELLFALSVKVPALLEQLFEAYANMDVSVQEGLQELLTPLISSLRSSDGKLLTLLRNCPVGAESLALKVLNIFFTAADGRPSQQLVVLAKSLIRERDLDARFLIPIIAEMDKADIIRHLPRIVSILDGKPENKALVKGVFSSVVTVPPDAGSSSSNMPRLRRQDMLTPAELMLLLHDSEKEIGIKQTMEAIRICFSMTDVYRSEILAAVMQQIMDKPVLPILFLRTVIQAVTTYKTLTKFVSTTLLSRLITKKVWTTPTLWEGFIYCAKVIAPASFGALLQLPKEQLKELVDKQPTLKAGLKDFVMKKAPNKTKVSWFTEIFGEDEVMNGGNEATPTM